MIDRIWFGDDRLSRVARAALLPAERLFAGASGLRTILYDASGAPTDTIGRRGTAKWEAIAPTTTPELFTTTAEFELNIMCHPAVRKVFGER